MQMTQSRVLLPVVSPETCRRAVRREPVPPTCHIRKVEAAKGPQTNTLE